MNITGNAVLNKPYKGLTTFVFHTMSDKQSPSAILNTGNKIIGIFATFDIDRAVFFGLLTRVWALFSGPVTAILIATRFTAEIQGYYYTFSTILALQVFVELGLGTVIIQFASHEWAKLKLGSTGEIEGDRSALSRLVSISRIAFKWYVIAGFLVACGVGIGGYIFFSSSPHIGVNWISPWIVLCLMSGIAICLVPIWSLLEGCNQVKKLYTFRFFQAVVASLSIWISMLLGAGLWTSAISSITLTLLSFVFLRTKFYGFLKSLLHAKPVNEYVNWRHDILPMQWRIALSWASGYFIFSFFVPVLFKYDGPLVAGQMGMTWSLVVVLSAVSSSWLSPKAPVFGMLIAQKKYTELDIQFWKTTKIVMGISTCVAVCIWSVVFIVYHISSPAIHKFSLRLLPPLPTGLFLAAQLFYIASSPFSTYLRAHKKEPLMLFSLIYAGLVGLSTFFMGRYYSVTGIAAGYLAVNMVLMPFVFFIWKSCRKKWHAPEETKVVTA